MSSAAAALGQPLWQLAGLYGVQTAYYDADKRRRQASPEALLAVLRALGAAVDGVHDAPAALRERRQALWQRRLEPVVVAWEGRPAEVQLRLPADQATGPLACRLKLESDDQQGWACDLAELPALQAVEVEGRRYLVRRLALPAPLPRGYHHLTLETKGGLSQTLVIAAPRKAYLPPQERQGGAWGVFLPLYALHGQRSWDGGDFSDLEALMTWVDGLGGSLVATLPLLAAFLDEPFDPSPYAPASRLFWNEFYIDVMAAPELALCPAAQALIQSDRFRSELAALRASPLVDYRRQMALKREVLEALARCFFAEASARQAAFWRFVAAHPVLEDYSRFRAAGERRRAPWQQWPQPLRDGVLAPGDYTEEARRYHLYVQWLAHEQLQAISEKARLRGQHLYLDLPLGVHPASYDVWRERDAFALGVTAGAPPDTFFATGQNWGFPPLHPQAIREQGFRYYIACLRHHLAQAGVLRIDHVMGLHRLFWIPQGLEARQGVYVRYPAQELYAILCIESQRQQALIVGEDLGTVPRYVRSTMARHNVQRTYVVQYALTPDPNQAMRVVVPNAVASANTHDMPPFAAFWQGQDIDERLALGLVREADARGEREARQVQRRSLVSFLKRRGLLKGVSADAGAVLRACLAVISPSPARAVLVNLEDLWLETQLQNLPGTGEEYPNWRRKARYSLEAFSQMPQVREALQEVDLLRKRGGSLQ